MTPTAMAAAPLSKHRSATTGFSLFPLVLFLLCLSPPPAVAQQGGGSNSSTPPPYGLNTKFNPSMAILIVVLITAFFFMGFFSIYIRQCGGDRDGSVRRAGGAGGAAGRSRRAAMRGLDPAVIETFPTLVYSDVKELKIGKGTLECAVCLCEFDDDETLRLLPRCSHAFHPDCIDMWLASHTTCPVCRDNLAAAPETPPAASDDTADAAVSSEADRNRAEEEEEEDRSAPLTRPDHVAIRVEEETPQTDRRAEASAGAPAAEMERIGSSKRIRLPLPWRSRSARSPRMTGRQFWAEDQRERFTLRLPEYVRREVMSGKLNRSMSVAVYPVGEGSSRRGYRGEGSSRGGRSFKLRRDVGAKSDRWAFLSRPLSFTFRSNGGGDGEVSMKRGGGGGEGSLKRGGGGEGSMKRVEVEGSTKGKVFAAVRPLDCLVGGSKAGASPGKDSDDEASTVAFARRG